MTITLNGTTAPVTGRRRTSAAADRDWRAYANCASTDPEIFHPEGVGGVFQSQERDALRVCGRCDVREQCLAWALETRQTVGVWGGMTERQRRRMIRLPESHMDRCLNAQAWIEAELAMGRTQKSIAEELEVDKAVVNKAVKQFQFVRDMADLMVAEEATV